MQNESPDFFKILEILSEHEVSYIVVGGICAVLLGAPVTTFDLDIVPSRDKENCIKLLKALEQLNAHYREQLPKKLSPTFKSLDSDEHHLLLTKYGPLDILGTIGDGSDFNYLISRTEKIQLDNGTELGILELKRSLKKKRKPKEIRISVC